MAPLRIGINALYLIPGGVGGTEIYLWNLLRALAEVDARNDYVIFTNRETGAELVPAAPNFRAAPQPVRASFRPARILWEQIGLPPAIARDGIDVLLNPGFTAPIFCGCPMVTVFHDLQHKRHPEYFRWFDLPFWRLLLHAAAQVSRIVVAVSKATETDVFRYYRLPPAKVRIVPHGVEPRLFGIAREPEPFLLCISTLHPHKNLDRLLEAFARFRKMRPDFRLVVAGLRGFAARDLEHLRAERMLADAVEFTGWLERDRLLDLYRRAYAFLYPTLFEGFGLPVLEALAAGVPAACSRIEPLVSLAGDAALTFDPYDVEDITAAMLRLVSDEALRSRLSAEGPAQAARFSWKATAEGTLAVLREAAEMW